MNGDAPASGRQRAAADAVAMLLVSVLSLVVLLYVAFGTAREGYKRLVVERVAAQGQIIQSAIETFVRPGLPLNQFVGYSRLAEPTAGSGIADSSVFDANGRLVFTDGSSSIEPLPPTLGIPTADGTAQLREDATRLQVVLPLRNRFEQVGQLILTIPRDVIGARVQKSLVWVGAVAAGSVPALLLGVLFLGPADEVRRRRWLNGAFAATYLLVAGAVVAALVSLYSDGSQAKGEALVASLGQRLRPVVDYRLNFSEIDGIDQVFTDYRRVNPEISGIGLSVNGKVVVHTDEQQLGKPWAGSASAYEYAVRLTAEADPRRIEVLLSVPKQVVYAAVLHSVKNFAALFVASALFATLFMQMARSIRSRAGRHAKAGTSVADNELALALVRPLFFLAIFIEHLSYAFLPQFVQGIVRSQGLSAGLASVPFIAYYLVFALVLLPAGRFEARFGAKRLIAFGLLVAAAGLAAMPLATGLGQLVLARMLTGIGQGTLFIGVQSYILANTGAEQRTRGASIIVVGFQGGMISGMAIGSLLVGYIGEAAMFGLAALLAGLTAVYAACVIPAAVAVPAGQRLQPAMGIGGQSLRVVLRDAGFMKTIVLIGIPAKAVLTGVVLFGMPLLLTQLGYQKEDIGQFTMVYAGAVIAASAYVAKLVDQRGRSNLVLFWGSTLTAAGVLFLAALGWAPGAAAVGGGGQIALILLAVITIGVAHGLINAPILTHVSELGVSARYGTSTVAATYRFLERIGHAIGPMLVGQLLIFSGNSPAIFVWVAVALMLFGLIFIGPAQAAPPQRQEAVG